MARIIKIKSLEYILVTLLFCIATTAFAATDLLPNLKPKPAFDMFLQYDGLGGKKLVLSALTGNIGTGPIELRAGEVVGPDSQNVYQRVYRDDGTYYDNLAGIFIYHDAHGHFHFDDYAEYVLEAVNAPVALQRTGHKTSFCLLDTDKVDRHLEGAPKKPYYKTCGKTFQGISVGWGDSYPYYLPDQDIDVTGLPTGDYKLVIISDPKNLLLESNDSDNTSEVIIHLDMEGMFVTLSNEGGGGNTDPANEELLTCDSATGSVTDPQSGVSLTCIDPNTIFAGASRDDVMIYGAGFSNGLSVNLKNGAGPTPKITDIIVVDENTMRISLTTKRGGPRSSTRIWDVQVGNVILPNSFAVFPPP